VAKKKDTQQNNLAIGIGAGLAIGAATGLTVFDNFILGLGAGLAIGVALGMSLPDKK
jgi:hypothetical protein